MRVLLFLFLFLSYTEAKAGIFFPWVPGVKANIGFDTAVSVSSGGFSKDVSSFGVDLIKYDNANIYAGVRLFQYFGIEGGFTRFANEISGGLDVTDSRIKIGYAMAKLHMPIINFKVFSLEAYGGIGMARLESMGVLDGNLVDQSVFSMKYELGLESSVFGIASFRTGWYMMGSDIEILNGQKMHVGYVGLSVYLL